MATDSHSQAEAAALRNRLRRQLSFWHWFWHHGLRAFWSPWLIGHVFIGSLLSFLIRDRLSTVAGTALIPLASLLVGLTFAWSGNAVALLQSDELQQLGKSNNGEVFRKWVFDYQVGILAVLVTTTAWSLLAAGLVNNDYVASASPWVRIAGRTAMFALSSLTIRECWSVASLIQRKILSIMIAKNSLPREEDDTAAARAIKALPDSTHVPLPQEDKKEEVV